MLCICNIFYENCPVCGKQPDLWIRHIESINIYEMLLGCSCHLNTRIEALNLNHLEFEMLAYRWKGAIKEFKKKSAEGYSEHRYSRKLTEAGVIERMSDNNPGAVSCLLQLLSNAPFDFHYYVKLLDDLGIYGTRIYMLWNDCCERDFEWFEATLRYFSKKDITADQIHKALDQGRARPFIKPFNQPFTIEAKEACKSEQGTSDQGTSD